MADLTRTVAIVFKTNDLATDKIDGVARSFKQLDASAGDAASKVDQFEQEIEKLAEKDKKIDALATSLKALAASLVVKAFIDANVETEKFILGMTQVTGTSESAARELDYVRATANRLGIEVGAAGQAWLGLSAATQGTALEGAGARAIFEAITAQFAVLGRSSADVAGALVQIQQGVSKGKFELEDLKSIAERMPGFFDKFAESLGITTSKLFDLISQGKIGGPEFLRFAESINASLAGVKVDTFEANLARLRNGLQEAFVVIGSSGAFDALTKGLQIGTAAIAGATQTVVLLATAIEGLYLKLVAGSNFNFGEYLARAVDEAATKTRAARDAMLGVEEAAAKAGDSGAVAGAKIAQGMAAGAKLTLDLKAAAKEVDQALKALGIDPKVFENPAAKIEEVFASLAKSSAATGEQIIVGLIGALRNLPAGASVSQVAAEIDKAFRESRITAEQYAQAIALIKVRLDGAAPSFSNVADAADKQGDASKRQAEETKKAADEMNKAKEAADRFALELEKLASNERIKTMEFRAEIDVARIQADAEKVTAAFESINVGIQSTGDVLGNLFGMFDKLGNLDSSAYRAVFDQIDRENNLREQSFEQQKKLADAQIENLRAQTRQLESGDALIKIDGAGLQPHLEAFMWEILRTIQTRVNRDGLAMLLGV